MRFGYVITKVRNAGIQHWRGLLRDYEVTHGIRIHACVGGRGCVHVGACMYVRGVCNCVIV